MNEQQSAIENSEQERMDPVTGKKDEFINDDDFSYSGYQITREEFFAHAREPSLTINGNKLYMNKVCLRKAPDTERVLLMISTEQKKIVVKPCTDEIKDSIPWVTAKGSMRYIICKPAFLIMLSELTGWNMNNRYKMIGKQIRNQGERLFVFDMDSALIYPRKAKIDDEGNVIGTQMMREPVYLESWNHQFGLPVEEHERVYAINRFDDFVAISVQDKTKARRNRPVLDRKE